MTFGISLYLWRLQSTSYFQTLFIRKSQLLSLVPISSEIDICAYSRQSVATFLTSFIETSRREFQLMSLKSRFPSQAVISVLFIFPQPVMTLLFLSNSFVGSIINQSEHLHHPMTLYNCKSVCLVYVDTSGSF